MAARHSTDLTVFNVAIEGHRDLDESVYARRLAEHFGLKFVSFPLDGETFRRELPKVVHQCDLPLTHPNSVAYHLICRVARRDGIVVLLSGEGADELFGGYDRYRKNWRILQIKSLLDRLPESVRSKLEILGLSSVGLSTSMHTRELLPFTIKLADRFARQAWQVRCERAYDFVDRRVERLLLGHMLADLSDFLTPLLRRLDRTSMANSIECRVPFLDHRLVHKAINLPLDYRVRKRASKWVLRKVAEDRLPSEIRRRKKTGFPLPLKEYLAPLVSADVFRHGFCEDEFGLRGEALETFLQSWEKSVQGFFSILCLEIWGRLVMRGEAIEEVDHLLSRAAHASGSPRSAVPVA